MATTATYKTLEDVQLRKAELRRQLQGENQKIGTLMSGLKSAVKPASKGEMITSLIANSITAFDAFLLVRKLMKLYGKHFSKNKKKKKR